MEKLVLTFGDKIVQLNFNSFDDEVDLDKILKIDFENLFAELITFPVIVNKFGLLLADVDNAVNQAKMDLEITEAKLSKSLKTKLTKEVTDSKGNVKFKEPTIPELEAAIKRNPLYVTKWKKLIEAQKDKAYVKSIYDALKDKSEKLNKLSLGINPNDFDEQTIQKQLNNVYFQMKEAKIK